MINVLHLKHLLSTFEDTLDIVYRTHFPSKKKKLYAEVNSFPTNSFDTVKNIISSKYVVGVSVLIYSYRQHFFGKERQSIAKHIRIKLLISHVYAYMCVDMYNNRRKQHFRWCLPVIFHFLFRTLRLGCITYRQQLHTYSNQREKGLQHVMRDEIYEIYTQTHKKIYWKWDKHAYTIHVSYVIQLVFFHPYVGKCCWGR